MDNSALKQLHQIREITRAIHQDLRLQNTMDEIVDKMLQRGRLIICLVESARDEDKKDILLALLVIRDQESELLVPYRETLQEVKSTLIKLKQSSAYHTA